MLLHAKGNLIDMAEQGKFHVIVHGCNCFNTMGKGIAREIRDRYPRAYEADCNYGPAGDINKLGNYSVMLGKQFNIINAYTQYRYWNEGDKKGDLFEYESFDTILKKLAIQYPIVNFGLPYIGMGLAGGDKDKIMAMLEDFAETVTKQGGTVTLVEFG